jgi:triphosphoribosyl-dephospho-CoA synthase
MSPDLPVGLLGVDLLPGILLPFRLGPGDRFHLDFDLSRTSEDVALAAQVACLLEVSALKPGNVNRTADFNDTRFEDFLLSAAAIGPALGRADRDSIGQIVWNAVGATRKLVQTNTNLGMILLLAPLARAVCMAGEVRANLAEVLANSTVEDARQVYAAIRLAHPGGLGRVDEGDVTGDPGVTLREAMGLAQDRDSIARAYVTDFAVIFELAYPALRRACAAIEDGAHAIVQAYLQVLAQVPDTLILRKRGPAAAAEVSQHAAQVLGLGGVHTEAGLQALATFDHALRDERHTLNPGTTADLIAAAIFLYLLQA